MDWQEYAVAAVVAGCLGLGFVLKHSLSFIPNKYIPLILGIAGVVLNSWLCGWELDLNIFVGGLISCLGSTGVFELGKNLVGKDGKSDGGD